MVVILPVYNEGKNIESLLEKLEALKKDYEFSIIAVDDGSTDETGDILAKHGITTIKHERNRGLGRALHNGFAYALKSSEDVIITMDADDTMDVNIIPLLAHQIRHGYGIAIASRYVSGAEVKNVPVWRRILSRAASCLSRAVFRIDVRDFSSGYRAYSADVLKKAYEKWGQSFITSPGFDCQIEILRKAAPYASKICEVPIRLDYRTKLKSSHFNFLKTTEGYMRQVWNEMRNR